MTYDLTMVHWIGIGTIVCVLVLAVGLSIDKYRIQLKRKRFAARASKSFSQIYDEYFKSEGLPFQIVSKVWLNTAEKLRLDPQKLRPTDRFGYELAPVKGYPVEDEILDLADILNDIKDSETLDLQLIDLGKFVVFVSKQQCESSSQQQE